MENNQTNTYMEETNSELVHTYNRFPVVLDHGEGVYLYDTEGKKYLDFAAGIAVCIKKSDQSSDTYFEFIL